MVTYYSYSVRFTIQYGLEVWEAYHVRTKIGQALSRAGAITLIANHQKAHH